MLIEELKLVVEGCKRGDRASQKALYDGFASKMLGVCARYVNDKDVARDLLHDGFIKIFTRIGTYDFAGSFEGWVRKVFVNTALEYLRKNDVLRETIEIGSVTDDPCKSGTDVLSQLSVNELVCIIAELPAGYRTVFNLFAVEGYSHKEIAILLNINESTSRSQYVRAKQMLQRRAQLELKING